MIATVEVISEETQSYRSKTSGQDMHIQRLVLLDKEPKARFKQMFDYDLEGIEKDRHTGKLVGKILTLGITDFVVFGGRLRCKGAILEVK